MSRTDRRTPRRAAVGLGLSVLGVVAWSLWTRTPPDELWWAAPAAVVAPHLAALAVSAAGRARPALLPGCAVVALVLALVLVFVVGFGLWQLPAAGVLLAAALGDRDQAASVDPVA